MIILWWCNLILLYYNVEYMMKFEVIRVEWDDHDELEWMDATLYAFIIKQQRRRPIQHFIQEAWGSSGRGGGWVGAGGGHRTPPYPRARPPNRGQTGHNPRVSAVRPCHPQVPHTRSQPHARRWATDPAAPEAGGQEHCKPARTRAWRLQWPVSPRFKFRPSCLSSHCL